MLNLICCCCCLVWNVPTAAWSRVAMILCLMVDETFFFALKMWFIWHIVFFIVFFTDFILFMFQFDIYIVFGLLYDDEKMWPKLEKIDILQTDTTKRFCAKTHTHAYKTLRHVIVQIFKIEKLPTNKRTYELRLNLLLLAVNEWNRI